MSGMISVSEALTLVQAHRPTLSKESVPLEAALGRRLAAPVIAQRTHPPAAMSAMDGYAVKLSDVCKENAQLRVIGEAPAGRPFEGEIGAAEAVRIFTGSVIPAGADTVIIQENVERDGDQIVSLEAYDHPRHIRAAGLDFRTGDVLIEAGTKLEAPHLSAAAASNNANVVIERRFRVGLLANGDELRPPGSDLGPGEIINSNPYGLKALVEHWGGEAVDLGIAGDSVEAIETIISRAKDIDVFVPIGGASVGDHDHMRTAFGNAGFEPVFEKIAVRPGKPTWFSKSTNALVLGLPGNPASAMVCAHMFLSTLVGHDPYQSLVKGKLIKSVEANGPREHLMRARLSVAADGGFEIDPTINQDSSLLRPFLTCNALLRRLPNAPTLAAGETADALVIGSLLT
ncbi:MAG: molybdopterin molybdotransferase MoeA [Henriciella sp.]